MTLCMWAFMTIQMTLCTHLISTRENIRDNSRTARMGAKRSWIGCLMVDWSATFPHFGMGTRYVCNAHREKSDNEKSFTDAENHL